MITMENVCKSYRIAKRNAGFKAACKALFHREYEEVHALRNVSFTIGDGEMVGYIGPNGAGKSSTIKILSGILTPDSGRVTVDGRLLFGGKGHDSTDRESSADPGYPVSSGIHEYRNVPDRGTICGCDLLPSCRPLTRKEKYRRIEHVRQIGVVFGQRSQLWWDVPVIDSFELLKDIYSVSDPVYRENLEELTELLNLKELLRTPARQLSLGQRMRCEIAASLLHSPRILFLDEPTIGLDAVSKLAVRDFIKRLNRIHGTTVILTTHDMQDIEALTRRIILIGKGRILMDGTLEDIKKRGASMDETLAELYRAYKI